MNATPPLAPTRFSPINESAALTRRNFITQTSLGIAALGTSALVTRAQGGANDRLSLGLIGAGGRGGALMGEILDLAEKHNVRIAGVCDVWRNNRQAATDRVKEKLGEEPRPYSRFGDLLAAKDIDAVVIATPDFSHGPILVASLKAGKDVYIEKPMTIELASANEALALARQHNRVVQCGTQRRSEGRFLGASKFITSGALGQISRISVGMFFNEARWIRDCADCQAKDVDWDAFLLHLPKRPFNARLLRQWQLYRETSNGLPGLWMTHYADLVHFLTGAKYPSSVVALGSIYIWKDDREHTDTFHTLLDYPEGFLFDWAMGLGNSAGIHFTVHGTKATLDLEKGTVEAQSGGGAKPVSQPLPTEPNRSHMGNWLQCLRSRQHPHADIQFGHQHAVATILAATALQKGRRQTYDQAKQSIQPG